jgi:biopolymer transport protein ExbD
MKGHTHTRRLVLPPGYNLAPKYDLKALRVRRNKGNTNPDFNLSLTAMIDMFSTLVVFLLLNFSATGEAYFVSKNVTIPQASNARPLESLPLVSIAKEGVSIDALGVVGTNPTVMTADDWEMPGLVAALEKIKGSQQQLVEAGILPKPEVNIQADQDLSVVYLKRVMNVLISEGFTGINFAVRDVGTPETH